VTKGSSRRQFTTRVFLRRRVARHLSLILAPFCLALLLLIHASAQTKVSPSVQAKGAPSPQERLQQHYDAARTYQLGGDQEHAAAEYRAFLAGALSSVARFRASTGDFVVAADLFEQASRFSPDNSDAQKSRLSPDERRQGEPFVSRLKPAIGDSYNNLGVILAARKDFILALDYFRKAAEWNPSLETLARNWGMAAFYAAQYDQAVEPLSRELAAHPDDLRVRAGLGLSLFMLQNYAKALETLRPIESEVDNDPGLQYAYAFCLVKTGEYPEGMRRLRSLQQKNPNSADVHMLLGQAFADQGEHGTALEEYRKALALDPNRAQLHYLTGLVLIRQGSPAQAEQELRSALKLNPADTSSKYHLAYALIQLQQKEEARTLMEEVIRHSPSHADAHYELGKLQLEHGEVKAAISTLETGIKLNPDGDYIHYQLAMAYRRDSRSADAEREIKLYQELKNRHRGRDVSESR
jgi:tetratricopeptide (TPR) repeat protein